MQDNLHTLFEEARKATQPAIVEFAETGSDAAYIVTHSGLTVAEVTAAVEKALTAARARPI